MITRKDLIKKYIEFFKKKDHKEIENSSLIPKGDPTVLFTTAGMHPLVPYLLGQTHPQGKRLVNVQRCLRTDDIDEVGDEGHSTFFEMLGNWSLGDYWKKEAIEMSYEFLTKELKIPKDKISVTCFKGDKDAQKDEESAKIWKDFGIKKIKFLGKEDNWWGPAELTGPCGPDTEMFVNGFEIWNDVFMQYNKDKKGKFNPASQKNVDTGMGVERTLAILNGLNDNYMTDAFNPIIEKIESLSRKKYKGNEKAMRIIADHIKASTFLISDGVSPSNKEQGYVLRRLLRRAIRHGKGLGLENFAGIIANEVFEIYDDYFPACKKKESEESKDIREKILDEIDQEEKNFNKTLENGLNKFKDMIKGKKILSGKDAFLLYQSYGFPLEITKELAKENKIKLDEKSFYKEFEEHQKLSQTAAEGKFRSGLADHSEATTKLHTAHHLLLASLRKILGNEVLQRGSNITPERLRLDFSFSRKLTDEEIKNVESLVNEQIKRSLPVTIEQKSPSQAIKEGALGVFGDKYGDIVSVYTVGNFSKEICTGPHVKNTKELGHFKILKEEASSAGVRRIKAVLE
ncbi:MAG TPA: alanine--tRNA ligase [Candidatus Nanoarchaeia archaeon]|nr:alanine--tRNA ligase [Candidatus Nanoarchaeia archaeon]